MSFLWTIGSFGLIAYLFPIYESPYIALSFLALLLIISIYLIQKRSKPLGYGILGGLALIASIAVFILIEASSLH